MATEGYQYSVAQCDIPAERRNTFESFRAKRAKWVSWLDHDQHHAIWTTISSLVWNDVSFRTLAHLALEEPESSLRNSLIAEHVINGHVATQILAIRRLMDNGRGNISLRRLLTELRGNFNLFTRENYVCFDGLPYDYESVRAADHATWTGGPRWMETSGPAAWGTSSMMHEQFDRLAGVAAGNRDRLDHLPLSLLDTIQGWLDGCVANELNEWSHAFLAHAGGVERRKAIADASVTNDKITDAIRVLARVTESISAEILNSSGRMNSLMPTAQYDQFENLEKPAAGSERLDEVRSIWKRLHFERDLYVEDVRDALVKGR